MADSWTLITPSGPYTLNASFSAPKYQAGGVSGPGALRRDDRNAYQRSGDGLATPGALVLTGRVWRDDQDAAFIVAELDAIREAVAACSEVVRTTLGGTYVYSGIAGGPTPEVSPDGIGGWVVSIELWPARATPTFWPADDGSVPPTVRGFASSNSDTVVLPQGSSAPQNGDLLVAMWADSSDSGDTIGSAATGWTFNGSRKSPPGGLTGTRQTQIAVAHRTWWTGDATTVSPFGSPNVNNTYVFVWVLSGAQAVTTAFEDGDQTPIMTPGLTVPVQNSYLVAAFLVPLSTAPGMTNDLPNPPFTSRQNIGSGFDNMTGYRGAGIFDSLVAGPFTGSAYASSAWVSTLFAAHQIL